jgi:hypothetical protein
MELKTWSSRHGAQDMELTCLARPLTTSREASKSVGVTLGREVLPGSAVL